jgi:hypothetical protein
MDPNRRTTSLPKGMNVRILSAVSRGGNIYGIDAEEVSKHTGIPVTDHARISDWASVNDAHFYAEKPTRFSLDQAAQEAAAMGVPRVVLFRIPDKAADPPPEEPKEKPTKKRKTPAKKKSETVAASPPPPPDLPKVEIKKPSLPRFRVQKPD